MHPLLQDDTCYFLAADFDEAEWRDDARGFSKGVVCTISGGKAKATGKIDIAVQQMATPHIMSWTNKATAQLLNKLATASISQAHLAK